MVHFLVAKLFFLIFSISYAGIYAADVSSTPVSVACSEIGGSRYLQLNCSDDRGLAVFFFHGKWYAVWDCGSQELDFSLPKQEDWPAGFLNIEKVQNIQSSRPCIILSLNISTEMMPIVIKTEKGWAINAISEHLMRNDPNPNQIFFDHQKLGRFRILNAGNSFPLKLHMPTGEEVDVTPTVYADAGLDALELEYIDLYESVQGVCLCLKSDQLFLEKQGKDVLYFLINEPMLHSEAYVESKKAIAPDITFIRPCDLTSKFRSLLAEEAMYDKKKRPWLLMKQAWIELALCEGEEAKQTTLVLGKEIPDFTQSLYYQVLLGFSQFLSQDYYESLKTLELLPDTLEVNFCRGLSKSQLGERVSFGEHIIPILTNYPTNLRDYILVKIVPHLFESQQVECLRAVHQSLVPKGDMAKAVMGFYYAMGVFNRENKEDGYNLLLPIARNETSYIIPIEFQTEARLETYLYKNADKPVDDIIKELDVLRTQARGSDVEVKICLKLIEYLEKKKDYPKIIAIVQDLIQRFNKFDISLGLHQLLRSYIQKFFAQENSQVSPVKTIGLFRKYKTFIERQSEYEKIAEYVVHQFERLDLLDQAASLLTELFYKTSDSEKRVKWQLKVGNIYVQDNKAEEAIKLLSEIYPTIGEKHQKEAAKIIAKAHLLQKNYEASIKWLKEHPNKENKRFLVDVYINMEDYPHIIESLKDYLLSLKDREDDDARELGLVQLAAAYYVQKDFASLQTLHGDHKDFMHDRKSAKVFEMLCRPRAEDLKTSMEVREYIKDADVLKEIFKKADSSIG